MLGESENNSGATARDRSAAVSNTKDNFPSIIISRGRTEPRGRGGKKKEERRGFGEEDGGGTSGRRGGGRRGPRKDREEFGGRTGRHKDSSKFDGPREFNSRSDIGQTFIGLPEDSRISTILRKLAREDEERRFTTLIKNLQDALALPDNAAYIRRSLDMILDSLYDIINNGPNQECQVLAACTLGHVGFTLDKDCKKFIDWVFNKYKTEMKDNTKDLLMTGLKEMVRMDSKDQKLTEHSQALMMCVREIMETTDSGDIFIGTVELTLTLINRYPELIPTHFHDTVDVLLGWHFETSQPPSVTECAGRAFTILAPYWVQDLQFTYTLLNDFFDDISAWKDQLVMCQSEAATSAQVEGDDEKLPLQRDEIIHRITSILGVVISVMKNLKKHLSPVIQPPLTIEFLNNCLERVVKYVTEAMEFVSGSCRKLVSEGNRCAKYLIAVLESNVSNPDVLIEFLYAQFRLVSSPMLTDGNCFSLTAKIINCVDHVVTTKFVDVLLCPKSVLLEARLTLPTNDIDKVYLALLRSKTHNVLIRSYAHIIGDLDAAMRTIKPDLPPLTEFGEDNPHLKTVYSTREVDQIILFLLNVLRELAVNRNPETPLLTLKPTLFDVLVHRMPHAHTSYKYPLLHYSSLKLLKAHCNTHDYYSEAVHLMEYAASQTLSLAEVLGVSTPIEAPPVLSRSYILSSIIELLIQNLAQKLEVPNKLLVIEWTHEILTMSLEKGNAMEDHVSLLELIDTFCYTALDCRPKVALACAPVLRDIVYNRTQFLARNPRNEYSLMTKVMDLCLYYLNSSDDKVRREYHLLMSSLPAAILTFVARNHQLMKQNPFIQLISYNYEDMTSSQGCIGAPVFREFMDYLLKGYTSSPSFHWMISATKRHYVAQDYNYEQGPEVVKSVGSAMEWLTFHAAKYCVENRLRTMYGKAFQTLTSIEETIRVLARETVSNVNLSPTPATCRRARLLIQFVEHFEKLLYNAVEGTASAFQVASKQTKAWFSTNRRSCFEWFHRVRLALLGVAVHCGMSAWAVRHGYAFLQYQVDLKETHTPEFETALFTTGLALANMGDRDAVLGLHIWARDASQSSHSELKPLIDMAARKYESAADKFEDVVADISALSVAPRNKQNGVIEKVKNMPITANTFLADQLTECYLALNSWDELASWKRREVEFLANEHGEMSRKYDYITANFADAMSKFDAGDLAGAAELLVWDENQPDNLFPAGRPAWDVTKLLDEADFVLKNIIVQKSCNSYYTLKALSKCGNAQTLAENVMEDVIKDSSSEILSKACCLKYVAHAMINRGTNLVTEMKIDEEWWRAYTTSPDMERLAWWAVALEKSKKPLHINDSLKSFLLEVIKASKKAGNLRYTTKCLLSYLDHAPGAHVGLGELAEEYILLPVDPSQAPALHQLTKLLRSTCDTATSVKLSTHISSGLFPLEDEYSRMLNSSVLRNVASIFASDKGHYEQLMSDQLEELVGVGMSRVVDENLRVVEVLCLKPQNDVVPLPEEEAIVGRILLASLGAHVESLKSWETLAAWCYEMGGKLSSQVWVKNPVDYGGPETLKVLSSYHSVGVDVDRSSSDSLEDRIKDLGLHDADQIKTFIAAWKRDNSRVYSFFKVAIHSYFRFLKISPYEENNCKFVSATLRLLRLMVKHASELQETVDADLADTPVHPWIPIVPQLLARLNHADPYIRKKVEELLIKIGLEAPHLILFPAVVGSGAMHTTKLFPMMKTYENKKDPQEDDEDVEEEDDDDLNDDDELQSSHKRAEMMENSFHSILDSLSLKYADEIIEVKKFVSELQRITLLWDELWLGALLQHQGDISRRFSSLQTEIKTTSGNTHLDESTKDSIIREKYRLILKPILFVFEQLNEITSVEPETPKEKQFQELYTETIQTILEKLRQPPDPCNSNEVWKSIQNLQHALQDKTRYRSGTTLSMSDLSTTLSKLEGTKIFMPGVRGRRTPPTIERVEDSVAILPTKTKPKKLVFCGSNGENYTYLFKGLEDLHLDERIMQFLSIANSMLKEPHLQAHHYSVVPLGPRSGLISWVENVTPIFLLYKKWQQREAAKNPDDLTKAVMRPSELFTAKLSPILAEHNILTLDQNQRHKWPVAALRKCLQELMTNTPTYLLYKELWAYSVNAAHWWRSLKTYSSSLAVMSMIGYIIGLGDRHLDNVLVNLKTGEVVHIDYNVCFEKGKTLRVPEKVPFRLTPNLKAALGVTGVEGVYKETCEHVLHVMREGQETLLTLLEAFVYDPLIDWTPFSEGGYTGAVYGGGRELTSDIKINKKELMKEVACAMFKVRLTESRYQWMENKKTLVSELKELVRHIKMFIECEKKKEKVQNLVKERHTQLALLKEAEGQPKHPLYTLHTRYSHYIQVHSAKEAVVKKLRIKMKESEAIESQYHMALQKLKGNDVANWLAEVKARPKNDVCQVFDLIKEFLSNAGQSQTVQQCTYSEKEMGEMCLQQTALTSEMLEMLRDYNEISRLYPRSHLASHRAVLYRRWSEKLLDDMTPSTCQKVMDEVHKELALADERAMQIGMFSAGLERHLTDATIREQKCLERSSEISRVNVPAEVPTGWLVKGGHWGEGSSDVQAPDVSDKAVSAVVLTALCALNKKFILIESQAMSAGDSLMNLTSQAGDWFLHDLCSVAGNIVRLTQLLPQIHSSNGNPDNPLIVQIQCALKCMNQTYKQLKELQEMYNNFIGIILVEAVQAQVCEEPSVVSLVDSLESLISSVEIPMSDIIKSLQSQPRNRNMAVSKQEMSTHKSLNHNHTQGQHGATMQTVETLQAGYEALLTPPSNEKGDPFPPKTADQGVMLLMGFNGLFNLEIPRNCMVHHLKQLASPPSWNIVDQIKEPQKYYVRSMVDDDSRSILDASFFVKKLSTVVEVLRMCRADASGFCGTSNNAPQVPHDLEALTKPMRKYIADYISCQLLGIFSVSTALLVCRMLELHGIDVTGEVQQKDIGAHGQGNAPLEELCKKVVECRTPELRTASGMVSQIEATWRQKDAETRIARDLANSQIMTQHLKVMLTAHHWLHDHLMVNAHNQHRIILRPAFLLEMRKAVMAMTTLQPRLKEAVEQQQILISSAEQRLKWAAGANPALCEVLAAFESSVSSHKLTLKNEIILATNVCSMANSILTHESCRTITNEAFVHDQVFISIIEECQKCYELSQKKPVNLTPGEQGLVALKPPKKKIDADWLTKAEELISASLADLKCQSEPLKKELSAAEESMRVKVGFIKMTMATHNHIIPDIKSLLKTLVKCDDSGLVGLDQYVLRYLKFVDTVNYLIKTFSGTTSVKFDLPFLNRTLQDIFQLIHSADSIYSELLRFSTNGEESERRSSTTRSTGVDSPRKSAAVPKTRDVGVKNVYAISVWRKVKFKLEGRDPDPGIKNSVKTQVNWTIAEATNLDNLALLYEGWTPWV